MLSDRLGQAIRNGELENVRMYIGQGMDVNRQCYSEMYGEVYPLTLACFYGPEEVIKELLKAGADPNRVSDGYEDLPAMFIAAENHVLTLSMMRCLISHGAYVDFRDRHGQTILHYLACGPFNDTRDNLLSAVKIVLDTGVSFYARTNDGGYTPLFMACKRDNIDLVNLFIAEGADVNFDMGRKTMLGDAAKRCNIDMFDMLLNAGANIHLNPDVLIRPCKQNDHAMIEKILDTCDVDINMRLEYYGGMTILHYACDSRESRHITSETVRLLLDRGADVRTVSDTGDTALHYAAMHCECDKIRQLLSCNHPLNIKNNKNQTPLVRLTQFLINRYSQSRQQANTHVRRLYDALYQAGLLGFRMLVTAGAKVTAAADVEHNLNQFHIKHPEAQLPDYEDRSSRSLKEMCRFVIHGTIPVPVDVSLCKLPIPKLLQEYLNFPELDLLVDEYLNIISTITDFDDDDYDFDDDDEDDDDNDDDDDDDDKDDDDDGGDDGSGDDDDDTEGKAE